MITKLHATDVFSDSVNTWMQIKVINFIPEIYKGITATCVKNENSVQWTWVLCSQLTGPGSTWESPPSDKLKFTLSDTMSCACHQENSAYVNLAVFQCDCVSTSVKQLNIIDCICVNVRTNSAFFTYPAFMGIACFPVNSTKWNWLFSEPVQIRLCLVLISTYSDKYWC